MMPSLKRRPCYPQDKGGASRAITWTFLLSLAFYITVRIFPFESQSQLRQTMLQASRHMARAETALKGCREELGLPIDKSLDINATGLIGLEFSEITTSVGQLQAKRTATNPNLAGLVVFLLHRAGVSPGDTIAVGASGSFPALILAVLAASDAMRLKPLVFPSLGASQYGANHMDFHWLVMQSCLLRKGVFSTAPLALSLGGEKDTAENMSPQGKALLKNAILASGYPFVEEPDLERNVLLKMRLYEQGAQGSKIKAFINVGGSISNIGTDPEILNLKPGLAEVKRIPPLERRGMVFAMAARDIPVIHLLFVRGLVQDLGLPYDPVPLPEPGEGALYQNLDQDSFEFMLLSFVYLALLMAVLLVFWLRHGPAI